MEFDSQIDLARDFTKDASLFADDLGQSAAGDEGAAILDAVAYSVNLLKKEPEERRRVLLLISETRDHGSHVKIDDTVAAIGQSNAVMYALAFSPALSNILDTGRGTNKDEEQGGINLLDLGYRVAQAMRKNVPSTIASMTGGEYETVRDAEKIRSADERLHQSSAQPLSVEHRPEESSSRLASDSSATTKCRGWRSAGAH